MSQPRRTTFAARVLAFLSQGQWAQELGSLPTFQALRLRCSRVLFLTARGFHADRCLFRASGLTYITILSLVPMLAFAFSVAKGLGAYGKLRSDTIEPFLDSTFGPVDVGELGAASGMGEVRVVIEKVLGFVENTQVSGLGLFGLALLAFTVIKLLGSIEQSFNEIWGVRRSRSLIRKVSDYMSITVVVPILLVTATSVNNAAASAEFVNFLEQKWNFGPFFEIYAKVSSVLVMWLGFAFVYLFMPNTKVRFSSALLGGVVGGSLWHFAQLAHVAFQLGIAKYNALYAGFAALPVFMIWIHVSWITVLLGAEAAHAHQSEPNYHRRIGALRLTPTGRELLALRALVQIVAHFIRGQEPPSIEELSQRVGLPAETLEEVLEPLRSEHLLMRVEDAHQEVCFLPGREPSRIHVLDVLDALRGWGSEELTPSDSIAQTVGECLDASHAALQDSRHNLDLRSLAQRSLEADADVEGEPHSGDLHPVETSPA